MSRDSKRGEEKILKNISHKGTKGKTPLNKTQDAGIVGIADLIG
jgi:hypothetical protein